VSNLVTAGLVRLLSAARGRASARLQDERGSVAVEFAMVALPFIFMMLAIFELGLYFVVATTLENATGNAARMIRTGEMQLAGTANAATFKTKVCSSLSWLGSSCTNNLTVDVRKLTQFTNPNPPSPVQNGNFNNASMTFVPGAPEDIILVRTFYKWPLLTNALRGGLQATGESGGTAVITSTVIFRNEPYE
jgi:Flp pilus assembly protein TadG